MGVYNDCIDERKETKTNSKYTALHNTRIAYSYRSCIGYGCTMRTRHMRDYTGAPQALVVSASKVVSCLQLRSNSCNDRINPEFGAAIGLTSRIRSSALATVWL